MRSHYTETGKIGKKGVFTIPAALRRRFGFADGSLPIVNLPYDTGVSRGECPVFGVGPRSTSRTAVVLGMLSI
jgi:hypothetical protein